MSYRKTFSLFIISLCFLFSSFLSIHATLREDILNARPRPVPVLGLHIPVPPSSCHVEDFMRPCPVRDQVCKTRKEKCGDEVSSSFYDRALEGVGALSLDGKYRGNNGFDDYRHIPQPPVFFVGENKAGSSKLSRKTNQGSLRWVENTETKLVNAGRVTPSQHTQFSESFSEGRIIRALSQVTLDQQPTRHEQFRQEVSMIFSQDPDRRRQELSAYCPTMHPHIMTMAEKHKESQGPREQRNLKILDDECTLQSNTPGIYSRQYESSVLSDLEEELVPSVCYIKPYSRQNLYLFLNFLNKSQRISQDIIAAQTSVSARVIGELIRNPHYAPTKEYEEVWEALIFRFQVSYDTWTMVP